MKAVAMRERLRPLRQPAFALLWSATVLSNLGFWVQDITLGWVLSDLTLSPALIALLPFAAQLPIFLLSLPAGAFADRTDLRRFLLTTQSLLIALVFTFAILLALDAITIPIILFYACASGTLMAIAAPARQAVLPSMVAQEDIRSAVMLSAMGYNASRAVGPMIGGFILAFFNPTVAMMCYGISCVLVAMALLRWTPPPRVPRDRSTMMSDMKAGFNHVISRPELRNALAGSFLFFLLISPIWAFIPIIAKAYSQSNTAIFGLFLMAIGIGSVLGGFSKTLVNEHFPSCLKYGCMITAIGMIAISVFSNLYLALGAFFVVGVGWIAVGGGINAFILSEAEPKFRARAISLVMIVFAGGLSFGSLVWGIIATHITVSGALIASALCLITLAGFSHFRTNRDSSTQST